MPKLPAVRLAALCALTLDAVSCRGGGAHPPVADAGAEAPHVSPDSGAPADATGNDGPDAGSNINTIACKAGVPVRSSVVPAPDPAPGLPVGITGLYPMPGATGVCADATLRIGFSQPPAEGLAGKVQVWKVGQPDAVVQTLDLAVPRFNTKVGAATKNYWPFFTDGNVMSIVLPTGTFAYGATYYVTVEPGTFATTTGETLPGITGNGLWRFTTAAAPPSVGANIVVTADGTGDFCSLQGAIDAIPAANTVSRVITLKKGVFHGLVSIVSKPNITLKGEDRKQSVIAAANNDRCNSGSQGYVLMEVTGSNDFVLETLTLHNLTRQVGTGDQAEALYTRSDRVILRSVDVISLQDTLRLDGRVYAVDSYVEGATDYIWGNGVAFFDHCEIRTVARRGYNVQARNAAGLFGYVFVKSSLTSDPGITGHFLARTNSQDAAPASHVAYIDCQMGTHIAPAGWLTYASNANLSNVRFWESGSTDMTGNPIDTSMRISGANKKPSSSDGGVSTVPIDDTDVANMRNPALVLSPWSPLGAATPDGGLADASPGN